MNLIRTMEDENYRLDKWLWAARFFKTRTLAQEAASGGKVQVNGQRVAPAKILKPGDRLQIRREPFTFEVVVKELAVRRGPASVAVQLYEETPASQAAREQLAQQLKEQPLLRFETEGRPTKQNRRAITRLRGY